MILREAEIGHLRNSATLCYNCDCMYLLVKKNLILNSFSLIFCSDERFVNATLEFLQKEVNINRFDLMVLPGGPAFLTQKEENLVERLELLIRAHKIQRIVLITHEDCGYYKYKNPSISGEEMRKKQLEDLKNLLLSLKIETQRFLASLYSLKMVKSYLRK